MIITVKKIFYKKEKRAIFFKLFLRHVLAHFQNAMVIEQKTSPLRWGELDLALFGIQQNWQGQTLHTPAGFSLAMDQENLWFVATRNTPPVIHPNAYAGKFTANLWQYDVAELFIYDPESGRYLEFNLAPNAAWWCAEFTAPRKRAYKEDIEMIGVRSYFDQSPDGSWMAAASIPLDILKARVNLCEKSHMNVTFIVDSPNQQFLTANPALPGKPNFHLTELFKPIQIAQGGLTFHNQQPSI